MNRLRTGIRFALVFGWLFMGLYGKVLDMIPRHRMIASRVLGDDAAYAATVAIGAVEVLIALWILTKFRPVLCALVQTALLLTMNIFELTLAPDLLLLGRAHIFVTLFCLGAIWFLAIGSDGKRTADQGAERG